jgi:MFS family permease
MNFRFKNQNLTIMSQTIDRNKLFVASCLALLVTSLSFGIRAGVLAQQGVDFHLDSAQLGTIAATAFWGFPLAMLFGGTIVDIIGMKRLLMIAFVLHVAGILLTVFATGYWTLFISTLCVGLANGAVEASCNPLVTSLFPDNKTTKLNHFHLWFPGGIVIGTLIVFLFNKIGLGTQIQVGIMLIPAILYGYFFSKLDFPITERVSSGVSSKDMYMSLLNPLFIFMLICMLGTAITELFTGQWIDVLLKNVSDNAILLLTIETGIMVIGRGLAEPVVKRFSPQGVLLMSTVLAALGLYILGHSDGNMLFVGAIVFGIGVCYFWPTMLGFVSENMPQTGAVGINLLGGAGMFAVSIYMIFMSDYYKQLQESNTPTEAGRAIINTTMIIPIILIVAFAGLNVYMKSRKKAAA